ncbi:hypothetical protein B0T26DRAFT_49434 [Lasiosphaeria miniovina]|uniref:Uncharacterized protein n=1 Tax=Lasiosphaeria miniovina TaxID=1954250 RepID=A0AA40EE18_9PEZI|nr:uncharacterized protein B0T26DRAFT_49434 [Lasiosphaeria miniovina]KAK0734031.1 hypothetical protein B0T26DRAFT_49434 [Lasiosphaeria miniovina]
MAPTALRPMTMAAAASGRQAWRQVMRPPASSTQKLLPGRQSEQLLQRRAASSSSSSPAAAHSIIQRPTAPAVSPRILPARNTSTTATIKGPKQQQRSYSSSSPNNNSSTPPPPPRGKNKNNLKFWPFLVVIALGSSSYILLVNRRKGRARAKSTSAASIGRPYSGHAVVPCSVVVPQPATPAVNPFVARGLALSLLPLFWALTRSMPCTAGIQVTGRQQSL